MGRLPREPIQAAQVDPFAGTQPGPHTFGGGHNFPGASVPFGMVQWSPDTTPPDRHSGGYDYRDYHVKGFSLTHLSGAGCALYGDFPFLPTTEPLDGSPAAARAPRSTAASSPASRTPRERPARLLLGPPQPGRRRRDRRRADRDHPHRDGALHLSRAARTPAS